MALYFFECTAQERAHLRSALNQEAYYFSQPLFTPEQFEGMDADITVLSTFIYSKITREVISGLPNLKLIITRSTGFNHIDLTAAAERGITVCNIPAYGENTVAEHAFGLLLALTHKIVAGSDRTQSGVFSSKGLQGLDIKGKTLGVIGTGHIGCNSLKIGQGFGMKLLGYDLFPNQRLTKQLPFTYLSLPELLSQADVLTLHTPLTPLTTHLINRENIKLIKDGAILINTARGELVETAALLPALESGQLWGVGLDVLEGEEDLTAGRISPTVQALLDRPEVIITPHAAFNTKEAIYRILDSTVETIQAFQKGKPINTVKSLPQAK